MFARTLRRWWQLIVRRGAFEQQLTDEMQFHLDSRADDLVATRGLSRPAALRRARLEFGSVEKYKDAGRQSLGLRLLDECRADVRFAARTFAKHKAFTATAIATLALGIGANTAVFSALDALRIRELPVARPGELVIFDSLRRPEDRLMMASYSGDSYPGPAGTSVRPSFSMLTFERFRDHATTLSHVIGTASAGPLNIVADGEAGVATGQLVSGAYYDGLGVPAFRGRTIAPADDRTDADPVAVISYSYWQQRFGGDAQAVGKSIRVNRAAFTIVGISPKGFHGTSTSGSVDVTLPLSTAARISSTGRARAVSTWWVEIMGRLKPGVTREQALADVQGLFVESVRESWAARPPTTPLPNRTGVPELRAVPGAHGRNVRPLTRSDPLVLSFAVVGAILVIGCANLATLLLARASARRQEVVMRMTLGASRPRIVRQFLTECLFLAMVGAALGTILAFWGKSFPAWLPSFDQAIVDTRIDLRVLAFTGSLSVLAAVVFGIGPAIRATRMSAGPWLKSSAQKGGIMRNLVSRSLIAAQVATSVVLLVGAGLLARTLYNFSQVNVGFDARNMLVFRVNPGPAGDNPSKIFDLYNRLSGAIEAVPGVSSSTLSAMPVLAQSEWSEGVRAEGASQGRSAHIQTVRWNFFETMGIPLVAGRQLSAGDAGDRPRVAIINETMAERLFGERAPLGRRFHFENGPDRNVLIEVVGIVGDAKYSRLEEDVPATFYMPYTQVAPDGMMVEIRTAGDPLALLPHIRNAVRGVDADLPLVGATTQEQQIADTLRGQRSFAILIGTAALVAVLLACIGLYGVVSHDVTRRTSEIGLRMALGARRASVVLLIMRQMLICVALGAVAGVALSYASTRLIKEMLFEVAPDDPLMMVAGAVLLLAVATLATYVPARRAARFDPTQALRCE